MYIKLFFYGLAFEPLGPLIHMIFQITWAVKNWCLVLFLSIVSFGTSLMVLYQYITPTYQVGAALKGSGSWSGCLCSCSCPSPPLCPCF